MQLEKVKRAAERLQEKMVSYRREFHKNPEIHLNMPLTSKYVKERLTAIGYEPVDCGECGVIATVGKGSGKAFLLRADMDALPMREESGEVYSSENGYMHACGHDLHAAMLLGAAEILKEFEDKLPGTVKLMFQPGEETLAGAVSMINAGALNEPEVGAAMMIHVVAGAPVSSGGISVPAGGLGMAACDWFKIHIQGRGGHGAAAHKTVDPINVAAHIHLALQEIVSRETNPKDMVIITVGHINAGATSNIIPDTADMSGTIRTFKPATREFVKRRLCEISELTAKAFRAEASVEYITGCPALINNSELSDSVYRYLSELGGDEVIKTDGPVMETASEDFSYISEKVPSIKLTLHAGDSRQGYIYPLHHPKTRFDESALANGAAAYAYIAYKWLLDN